MCLTHYHKLYMKITENKYIEKAEIAGVVDGTTVIKEEDPFKDIFTD